MSLNILIVDDSRTVRAVIIKSLQLAGVPCGKLLEAENGCEALSLLEDEWIDLVLTDINMPVMGGVEMIEKMSESGILKTIPVVVVSTDGSQTRIEHLKRKGVCAYIRKPFTPEMIREVIDAILETKQHAESGSGPVD